MSYRTHVVGLADHTADSVRAMYADLGADEFIELAAVAIATANRRAVLLADLSLSVVLSAQTQRAVLPLGLEAPDDLDRLRKATATVAALDSDARVYRLGRSEPLAAGARAYSEGIRQSPHVEWWSRQLDADPCERCQRWAAGGPFPSTVAMKRHPGCACVPIPVAPPEEEP